MMRVSFVRSLFMRFAPLFGVIAFSLVGFFGTVRLAHAAALTSTNVQPASLVAGSSTTVTVTFTTATNLPNNGKIKVTFGSGFDTSTFSGPVNCTGLDGSVTFGRSGQVVTLTRNGSGTTTTAPAAISCGLPTITNPTTAGTTGTYTIQTTDSSDVQIDVDAAVAADTIVAATLTSTNVQPGTLRTGASNTITVSFTLVNTLEANGKIKVTFPAGFNVASASGGACSTMDGSFTTAVASQVVTLTRSGGSPEPAGAQTCTLSGVLNPTAVGAGGTYTITTTNNSDATHDTDAAVGSDIFSSGSYTASEPLTYSIDVVSPVEGDVYEPGDMVNVAWTSGGTGSMSYVNISYSDDGGSTWVSVVTHEHNSEDYLWTVPALSSDEVVVKVEGTDLATVLATGESDVFTITVASSDEENTVEGNEDGVVNEEDTEDDSGSSSNLLPEGTYVRWEDASTVYFVDSEGSLHPFLDAQTYFTYADDFDAVVELDADEIAQYSMGSPMLPHPGAVLVKIESVAKVYALVEEEGVSVLRWITSEDLAEELYGSSWADYVIDVPVTAWSHFEIGDDVESSHDISVDISNMLTREEVQN